MTAKPLMIQGTMSGVGKSLLVAGLCRVLAQDGVRVAPFKSQNMALNSAITDEGLEMGRAQALQAEAAGTEPRAAMNPILLKPTTDTGSQVVVNGKPVANMAAREYFGYRGSLRKTIMDAYGELAADFDVVLIEGAGSPVELNLKRDDIVNMGMAQMAQSPVLLVGDIDRGGVFAQLIGTLQLLEPEERHMVRASVVNKFRGDISLFDEGVSILQQRMSVPVAGVVPYMHLDLDEEDSLSEQLNVRSHNKVLDVAVVRLPRISNYTDFAPLAAHDLVGVRYVSRPSELGDPDLLVLPGTKSTLRDLQWLRDTGLADAFCNAASHGTPTLGICGGYQMLGLSIADPCSTEGGGTMDGLGLLPVRTTFEKSKHTVRSYGKVQDIGGPLAQMEGATVSGYEIHMGTTTRESGTALLTIRSNNGQVREDGCALGNVYGCYLHGLFDEPEAGQALVEALLHAKGLAVCRDLPRNTPGHDGAAHTPGCHPWVYPNGVRTGVLPRSVRSISGIDMAAYRNQQLDLLAEGIRASMNMDLVYRIIEEGI